MQSRYYNPTIGRFLNADALVSTGQGILGNNMFTYCLNNPVAYSDSQGTDAKVCIAADGTIDEIPWWDHSPGGGGFVYHCANITTQYDGDKFFTQIALRHVGNFFETLWEAYVHSNELQVQQQIQRDMTIRKGVEILADDPAMAVNLAVNSVGAVTSYVGLLGAIGVLTIPTPVNIAVAAVGLACSLWGDYGATKDFFAVLLE